MGMGGACMSRLGDYIREKRNGMSLRKFAQRCGVSHTHIDSIEKGIDPRTGKPVRVTTETLKKIADGIGTDFLYLSSLAEEVEYKIVQENKTDGEVEELRQQLKDRPELKMLFSVSKDATRDDILKTVKILKAMQEDAE